MEMARTCKSERGPGGSPKNSIAFNSRIANVQICLKIHPAINTWEPFSLVSQFGDSSRWRVVSDIWLHENPETIFKDACKIEPKSYACDGTMLEWYGKVKVCIIIVSSRAQLSRGPLYVVDRVVDLRPNDVGGVRALAIRTIC